MSGVLCFRRTPKKWAGSFDLPLRDKIYERIGKQADIGDLSYFEGLLDACIDKADREHLEVIIEILNRGDTIDFKMEY